VTKAQRKQKQSINKGMEKKHEKKKRMIVYVSKGDFVQC
jgi:hypothetical protein